MLQKNGFFEKKKTEHSFLFETCVKIILKKTVLNAFKAHFERVLN